MKKVEKLMLKVVAPFLFLLLPSAWANPFIPIVLETVTSEEIEITNFSSPSEEILVKGIFGEIFQNCPFGSQDSFPQQHLHALMEKIMGEPLPAPVKEKYIKVLLGFTQREGKGAVSESIRLLETFLERVDSWKAAVLQKDLPKSIRQMLLHPNVMGVVLGFKPMTEIVENHSSQKTNLQFLLKTFPHLKSATEGSPKNNKVIDPAHIKAVTELMEESLSQDKTLNHKFSPTTYQTGLQFGFDRINSAKMILVPMDPNEQHKIAKIRSPFFPVREGPAITWRLFDVEGAKTKVEGYALFLDVFAQTSLARSIDLNALKEELSLK